MLTVLRLAVLVFKILKMHSQYYLFRRSKFAKGIYVVCIFINRYIYIGVYTKQCTVYTGYSYAIFTMFSSSNVLQYFTLN